jgi:hypothetical protein
MKIEYNLKRGRYLVPTEWANATGTVAKLIFRLNRNMWNERDAQRRTAKTTQVGSIHFPTRLYTSTVFTLRAVAWRK